MPMPVEGPWPPRPYTDAYTSYRDWDALYAGDPDRLREVFANRGTSASAPPSVRNRSSQYRGGVVGRLSRWVWGNPIRPGERDTRLHMPLPADLSATAAKLLFAEAPTFTSEDGQDRIGLLEERGLHTFLHGAAEVCSAFGDVYLRPVIDQEVSPDAAIPTIVHADGALPVIRWGRLVEVTFWSEVANNGTEVQRLLEHHEKGRITYALHEGTADRLGAEIPLDALGDSNLGLPDVDADGSQLTGLDRLDVVRVPNDGPQRQWRTDPTLKYLGRSDFSGAEQWFDAVDEAWTSWMRDIRLAKGRMFVPSALLEDQGAGQGATWNADQEIFAALNALPDQMGTSPLTATQFAIRFEEHRSTIDALSELILRHAGLSSATLGDPPEGAQMTATETRSRERMSFLTGDRRIGIWKPRLAEYFDIHTEVEVKAGIEGAVQFTPEVEFADSLSEDPKILAETAQLLRAAEAASTRTLVELVHPDWDTEQIDDEVAAIESEKPPPVEDVESFGRPPGQQEDPPEDEA